jgi:hypothetical protein
LNVKLEQLEAFGKFWNFSIFSLFFLWPFWLFIFIFTTSLLVSKFCLLHVFFVGCVFCLNHDMDLSVLLFWILEIGIVHWPTNHQLF